MSRLLSRGGDLDGSLRSVLRSGGARVLIIPISAIFGIICTRVIVSHYGEAAYAQYGLLVGLGNLLPFADLGMAAAIMNAVAASDDPAHDEHVRKVVITSLRVLFCSMLVFVAVAAAFAFSGIWPALLGAGLIPGSGPIAASLCLGMIGVSLLVGFGQRILSGLGLNHVTVLLFGLQTPLVLCVILIMVGLQAPAGAYLSVLAYVSTFALYAVACWIAARKVRPLVGDAVREAPHVRSVRGGHVSSTAWPTLVQLVALPIAMQTDRVVLSHVSSLDELAKYNLASQMYTPVVAVVAAAGVALWPIYAKSRADGTKATSPFRMALGFGLVSGLVGLLIMAAAPWLADKASGGAIGLGPLLLGAFTLLVVCQALKTPLGMYMTDPRGLRYQAYLIPTVLVPLNLGLSIVLAQHLGASGPILGSVVAVLLCQVLANWLYVRRDLARRSTVDV